MSDKELKHVTMATAARQEAWANRRHYRHQETVYVLIEGFHLRLYVLSLHYESKKDSDRLYRFDGSRRDLQNDLTHSRSFLLQTLV